MPRESKTSVRRLEAIARQSRALELRMAGASLPEIAREVGYAHSSDVSLPALGRAADAVHAVRGGYSGTFAAAPPHTNVRLYGDENPLDGLHCSARP